MASSTIEEITGHLASIASRANSAKGFVSTSDEETLPPLVAAKLLLKLDRVRQEMEQIHSALVRVAARQLMAIG